LSEPVLQTVKPSKRKGVTQAFTDEPLEEDERIRNTKMITDLFDLKRIMNSKNFAVKSFKDSYYVGELNPESN